eukprot:4061852-Prymnesium_polylepis.1
MPRVKVVKKLPPPPPARAPARGQAQSPVKAALAAAVARTNAMCELLGLSPGATREAKIAAVAA